MILFVAKDLQGSSAGRQAGKEEEHHTVCLGGLCAEQLYDSKWALVKVEYK